jgi:predicted TIM-barrel enzyme
MLTTVKRAPVIAGIGPTDPFRDIGMLIDETVRLGFSGVTNVPSNSGTDNRMPDAVFSGVVQKFGMGLEADLELIRKCRTRDVFTFFYAFSEEDMIAQIREGVDMVSVHVGGTSGGTTGVEKALTRSIKESCDMTQRYYDIAIKENPDIIIVTHGGPFEDPESLKILFDTTQIHGTIGASSIERLPTERELTKTIMAFKKLKLGK